MIRDPTWWRYDAVARRLTLTLHVQPNARASGVAGLHGAALKIRVAAPPADNKANAALIDFLSTSLGVGKSAIAIRRGAGARRKMIEIIGGPELVARVKALA